MKMLVFVSLLVSCQLVAGGLALGAFACALRATPWLSRRRTARLSEISRIAPVVAAAATPVAAILFAAVTRMSPTRGLPQSPGGLWAPLVLGGVCASGGALILAAGRIESRGRRRRAGRLADGAGRLMFLASAAYAVVLFGSIGLSSGRTRGELLAQAWSPALLTLSAITLGLAGFVGLLAGLSRKPRPSGTFAALLYVASQWALLAALGI